MLSCPFPRKSWQDLVETNRRNIKDPVYHLKAKSTMSTISATTAKLEIIANSNWLWLWLQSRSCTSPRWETPERLQLLKFLLATILSRLLSGYWSYWLSGYWNYDWLKVVVTLVWIGLFTLCHSNNGFISEWVHINKSVHMRNSHIM